MQTAPVDVQAQIQEGLREFNNIILAQIRIGVGFSLLIVIALLARDRPIVA
jgi:hypothetical protein